jgi:hypothetical protein
MTGYGMGGMYPGMMGMGLGGMGMGMMGYPYGTMAGNPYMYSGMASEPPSLPRNGADY